MITFLMDAFAVEHDRDFITNLRLFWIRYSINITTSHLDISYIKNKVELLSFLIGFKFDILLESETKIDGLLSTSTFLMSGYISVVYV